MGVPQHSSLTWEHPTPKNVVNLARQVLGRIDLDPATTPEFNRASVSAKHIFTAEDDGLTKPWHGSVFLNPPGGSLTLTEKQEKAAGMSPEEARLYREHLAAERRRWGTNSRAAAWWRKLVEEYDGYRVDSAIFIGFTLEILRSTQGEEMKWRSAMDFPFCVPRTRLCFSGDQPTHANVIVYIGVDTDRFKEHFETLGKVRL